MAAVRRLHVAPAGRNPSASGVVATLCAGARVNYYHHHRGIPGRVSLRSAGVGIRVPRHTQQRFPDSL